MFINSYIEDTLQKDCERFQDQQATNAVDVQRFTFSLLNNINHNPPALAHQGESASVAALLEMV
jgi:hypothetical protein